MRRVLLIVIDALTDRLVRPLIDDGKLPHFRAIRDQGQLRTNTSIFPSITHACLSSIATGCYPCDHQVLGGHWYLPDEQDQAYYGTDPDVIFHRGIENFFEDFVVELNGRRLEAETVFQAVENAGLRAASLNYMIYKGDVEHDVNLPFLMQIVPGINDDGMTVRGPSTLYLGEFVKSSAPDFPDLQVKDGPTNWFGFQDVNTGYQLRQLASAKAFPPFTLAYFPRNDYLSHSEGPEKAHFKLKEFDALLGEMFEAYGGIDKFMSEMCLLITGDHSQTAIDDDSQAAISLPALLEEEFSTATEGEEWQSDFDILGCSNLRAAQLYFKDPTPAAVEKAIEMLRRDARIDQVILRAGVLDAGDGYLVLQDSKRLQFQRGDEATDQHGNGWQWEGDLAAVDGRVEDGRITFPAYPNAFERLEGVLRSKHIGQLWLTARPGYEFDTPLAGIHQGGGSHGALHVEDSLTVLFLAGDCGDFELPANPRLVDIKPICLQLLGIDEGGEG